MKNCCIEKNIRAIKSKLLFMKYFVKHFSFLQKKCKNDILKNCYIEKNIRALKSKLLFMKYPISLFYKKNVKMTYWKIVVLKKI